MAAHRFMRKGTTKCFFVPTIAVKAAPTVAEVTAGTSITPQMNEVTGFTFANSPIKTPDMDSTFTKQIPGEDDAADSSMKMYEITGATDTIKAALAKDVAGFIVWFPGGIAGATPAAADKAEVWPVIIASNAREYTTGNESALYNVMYSITDVPALSAVVAA